MKNNVIKINELFTSLKSSRDNFFLIYGKSGKEKKYLNEVYHDVLIAINNLSDLKLVSGDRVGIIGNSSYEYVVLDLACVFLKLCSVPMDPEKINHLEEQSRLLDLKYIFTNISIKEKVSVEILSFQDLCTGEETVSFTPGKFRADDVFTVIFSSGTKGTPKASQVHVKCFEDQFSEAVQMFDITKQDTMLVFLPMHIYLERCYIYLSILCGFNLVIAESKHLLNVLKYDKISFTVGVPYFFEAMMELFISKIAHIPDIHKLYIRWKKDTSLIAEPLVLVFNKFWGGKARFFLTGSAPCKKQVLQFYHAMRIPLFEGYGMSEMAGMIALNTPNEIKIGSVGKLFPNKEVYFDEQDQIVVKSEFICNKSYLNEPESVGKKVFFKPNHIATGDVGYIDDEGFLFLTGRVDDIITLTNGRKVYPSYIEEKLKKIEAIQDCAVFDNEKGELVTVLVSKENTKEVLKEFINKLNQSLPKEERITNYIVFLEPFSSENQMLTSSYKLNRTYIKSKYTK